jgi:hypothetical protein
MRRTPIQIASLIIGVVFVLIGILSVIPGVTSHLGDIKFAGHASGALLFGVFAMSILLIFIHVAMGVWGMLASKAGDSESKGFLIAGGIYSLILALFGLLTSNGSNWNFIPLNGADDWMHLGLGVLMLLLGTVLGREVESTGYGRSTDDDVDGMY